ncbi:kinase-like domain-containing protein [Thelonectria olida]|uniref:Kinase-like domain-containing protein n=1 Tax=Thelonectria olida TaxID=1576542 RepID=A0A9P9ASB7_9HYPO|nr:kinase-like domain-containing protein [Thelonectria olida]
MSSCAGDDDSCSSDDESYCREEPPELDINIGKLKAIATATLHATCTSAKRIARGAFHEIYILRFRKTDKTPFESLVRAGYSCIARFTRTKTEGTAKGKSAIATIRYIKQNTTIPVPEIYSEHLDPDHEVGAALVLMERLPGKHLYRTWYDMSLERKKHVLSQVASVIIQLSSLKFDKIGSLHEGGLGPAVKPSSHSPQGPFDSTHDYLQSFISPDATKLPKLAEQYAKVRTELANFMARNPSAPYLSPPFTLIHGDFDAQNMLFLDSPDGSGSTLTGLIDFEYSYVGPIYFLYEYPIFIQDVDFSKELYAENAILRAHFVSEIFSQLRDSEARGMFIACMNAKCHFLNDFENYFMRMEEPDRFRINSAINFLKELKDGTGLAYCGRQDFQDEFYTEDGKPMVPKAEETTAEIAKEVPVTGKPEETNTEIVKELPVVLVE